MTAFGRLDVFVPVSLDYGLSLDALPADGIDAAFDDLFSLNVKAYLLGAKAAVEPLRRTKGTMIFTASNAAFSPGAAGRG